MKPIKFFAAIMVGVGAFTSTFAASGPVYPDKPVHVIVPFGAGGGADMIAHIVCPRLSQMWGQPVTVENQAGAGGTIGANFAAKSPADGYTLLLHSSGYAVSPALYAKLPYELKDLTGIALIAGMANVLVVQKSSGYQSVADLIAAAKANPGKLRFGSAGTGSGTHLNAVKFNLASGIEAVHVPNDKGAKAANEDLLAGRIDYWFAPIVNALPLLRADSGLRALGVSSAQRSPLLPEVPTLAEAGLKGFDYVLWYGVWTPAGTPTDVMNKLAKNLSSALSDSSVLAQFNKNGITPMSMTSAKFSDFVRDEIAESARIVKAAGLKPQ